MVNGVSASLDGAREAGRHEGTKFCIDAFGTSKINWKVGPDTEPPDNGGGNNGGGNNGGGNNGGGSSHKPESDDDRDGGCGPDVSSPNTFRVDLIVDDKPVRTSDNGDFRHLGVHICPST